MRDGQGSRCPRSRNGTAPHMAPLEDEREPTLGETKRPLVLAREHLAISTFMIGIRLQ